MLDRQADNSTLVRVIFSLFHFIFWNVTRFIVRVSFCPHTSAVPHVGVLVTGYLTPWMYKYHHALSQSR